MAWARPEKATNSMVGGSNPPWSAYFSLVSGPGDSPHDIWSMVHWLCSRDPQIKHSGEKNERGKNKKTGLVGCGGDYFGDVVGGRHRKGQQP